MDRRQYLALVAAVVLSGLAGGAISERLFSPGEAVAARNWDLPDKPLTEVVVPKGGFLFKSNGKVVAKIAATKNGGAFVLYGRDGKDKVRLSAATNGGILIIRNGSKTSTSLGVNGGNVLFSMKSNGGNNVTLESKRNAGSMRLVGGRAHFLGRGYNIIHPSKSETTARAGSGKTRKGTVAVPKPSSTGKTEIKRMIR